MWTSQRETKQIVIDQKNSVVGFHALTLSTIGFVLALISSTWGGGILSIIQALTFILIFIKLRRHVRFDTIYRMIIQTVFLSPVKKRTFIIFMIALQISFFKSWGYFCKLVNIKRLWKHGKCLIISTWLIVYKKIRAYWSRRVVTILKSAFVTWCHRKQSWLILFTMQSYKSYFCCYYAIHLALESSTVKPESVNQPTGDQADSHTAKQQRGRFHVFMLRFVFYNGIV